MMTFLEYVFDVDQISKMLANMRSEERSSRSNIGESPITAGQHLNAILGHIPQHYLEKLPDNTRADLAFLLVSILNHHLNQWNELKSYINYLWDQPVNLPGKTLGKELLNKISAGVMNQVNAPFFISYSGPISRHSLFNYTNRYPKLTVISKNYGFGTLSQVEKAVQGDYAEYFNNSRELMNQ